MRKQLLSFETKYKLCLWKTYFDTGYAITTYLKYPLILLGFINKISISTVVWWSVLYAIWCFFFGYFWYRSDFAKAQQEVSNRYNKLAIELRKGLKR